MVIQKMVADAETAKELSYFVKVFSLLGCIVLVIFGALQISFEGNPLLGFLEIAGGLTMALNILVLRLTRNIGIARMLLLASIIAFLLIMFVTGGTQETGIFWYFVFPVAAFFLLGRAGGIIAITILYVLTIAVYTLFLLGIAHTPYSLTTVRQLLISLFVVSFAIYVYQKARETAHSATNQSRRDLQTERNRAEAIVNNIAEGIVTLNAEGRITFVNGMGETLLNLRQNQLAGKFFTDILALRDPRGQEVTLEQFLASNKQPILGHTDTATLALTLAPAVNESDGSTSGIVTLRDVTDERAIDRAKSEFVTIASHQLRTPLSAVSWFSEMLLSGDAGKLTKEQHEDVEKIHQSSRRMTRLVNEMLVVSSLELGELPIKPKPINLKELTHSILQEQLTFFHDAQVPKVKEHYDTVLPEISFDSDVIKSVLHHIIANALKYTRPEGHVSIEITKDTEKLNPSSKGSVVIIVSDSGFGIPKHAQSKIFTKFFRADNIKDKDTDGTGLGLYIVKALLDYAGGGISFTSEEGQGSTFIIRLPLEGMQPREAGRTSDNVRN